MRSPATRILALCLLLALSAPAAAAKKKKATGGGGKDTTFSDALARGDAARQKGQHAEAEAAYREAAKASPARAEPLFFMGMTTRAAGRTEEAMFHYQAALKLSPQLAEAHMNVASLLSQVPGRELEALDHYTQALELREWSPELSAQAQYNSGICLFNLQRISEAREAVERTLALTPNFAPAQELLEQIDTELAEGGGDAATATDEAAAEAPEAEAEAEDEADDEPAAEAAPTRQQWGVSAKGATAPQGGAKSAGGGASTLDAAIAQLELHVMHALAQPADGGASKERSAKVSQLIASLSTLLARDLRS